MVGSSEFCLIYFSNNERCGTIKSGWPINKYFISLVTAQKEGSVEIKWVPLG